MKPEFALKIILVISIAGLLFSGYLSYTELIVGACGIGGCSNMFGLPVCVYGFGMYLLVFIVSILGITKESAGTSSSEK